MHTEAHVHGVVPLKSGVTQAEVEQALRPWLDYVDLDGLADARSAHQDEPGIVFDRRRRVLDVCWTGWVGRNFQRALESAFESLCSYAEQAAGVEVTFYHEDGRDERTMAFVGPSPEAIQEEQRRSMIEDVSTLLSRHFAQGETGEVLQLVHQLFERRMAASGVTPGTGVDRSSSGTAPVRLSAGKKHLH
jgi:hypothetical protein